MKPGTRVRPHTGPSNERIRVHLGLEVPEGCCGIRVGTIEKSWREGELLIFDDSFEHEVWHRGEKRRLVLIVDFLHPDLEGVAGSHYVSGHAP
jgi:aspartate beta-hydroxylase